MERAMYLQKKVNKITLSLSDGKKKKKKESFNKVKSYTYWTSIGKVRKLVLLLVVKNNFMTN